MKQQAEETKTNLFNDLSDKITNAMSKAEYQATIRWTADGGEIKNSDIDFLTTQTIIAIDKDILKPWETHILELLEATIPSLVSMTIQQYDTGGGTTNWMANAVNDLKDTIQGVIDWFLSLLPGWLTGNNWAGFGAFLQLVMQMISGVKDAADAWDLGVAISHLVATAKPIETRPVMVVKGKYSIWYFDHVHNECDYPDCTYEERPHLGSKTVDNEREKECDITGNVSEVTDYQNPYQRIFRFQGGHSQSYHQQEIKFKNELSKEIYQLLDSYCDRIEANPIGHGYLQECMEINRPTL